MCNKVEAYEDLKGRLHKTKEKCQDANLCIRIELFIEKHDTRVSEYQHRPISLRTIIHMIQHNKDEFLNCFK
jgi:hypothetical protein